MQYVNSIPLNGTITVYTPSGSADMGGEYTYTKSTVSAAIFRKSKASRDDFQKDYKYSHVILTKDVIDKRALIYLGTTSETDPLEVASKEIYDFSPMEDVNQTIIGYKLWL